LRLRLLVVEQHSRPCDDEHPNRGGANAPRTSGDESDLAREREMHVDLVSGFGLQVASWEGGRNGGSHTG